MELQLEALAVGRVTDEIFCIYFDLPQPLLQL
jgi:hypothetical protein